MSAYEKGDQVVFLPRMNPEQAADFARRAIGHHMTRSFTGDTISGKTQEEIFNLARCFLGGPDFPFAMEITDASGKVDPEIQRIREARKK